MCQHAPEVLFFELILMYLFYDHSNVNTTPVLEKYYVHEDTTKIVERTIGSQKFKIQSKIEISFKEKS